MGKRERVGRLVSAVLRREVSTGPNIYATLADGGLLGLRCDLSPVEDFGTLELALRAAIAEGLQRSNRRAEAKAAAQLMLEIECIQAAGSAAVGVTASSCNLLALRQAVAIRVVVLPPEKSAS